MRTTCCHSRKILPEWLAGKYNHQTHPNAPTGFEVLMANAIRPWQGCNLKTVLYSMLPKLLSAEDTKAKRLILCSAFCLSSADYRESWSWRLASAAPLFPYEVGDGQETTGRVGEGEDYPEEGSCQCLSVGV